jgi:D-aminoacyl-tRNA deacylase
MRAIVQRVSAATVQVDGREVGRCGRGLLLLVGVHKNDTLDQAKKLAQKISTLRIFNDHEGKMNLSIQDFKDEPYEILAVSNFTVYGDAKKSNRPSFTNSAPYSHGEEHFHAFVNELRILGILTQTGTFGADMQVSLINDGPVTVILDVDAA